MARPIEQLREAKSKDAKWVGNETIDGRKTEIFDVQNGKILGSTGIPLLRVWVDRDSQLPVKIVAEDKDPKSEMRITLEHIEWNVPLESSLFAMEIPEGYTEELKKDVSPSNEMANTAATALDGSVLIATDRVPRALVWSSFNNRLTVLATDPENVAPQKSKRNEIRQYDMLTDKQLSSIERSTGSEVASTTDGGTIAYAIGREVQIVSSDNEKVLHKIVTKHVLPSLALSQSGKLLVTGSTDWQAERKKASPIGFIEVWNVSESRKLLEIPDDSTLTFTAISPNEETFLTGSNSGVLKLRSIATGEMLHQFDGYQRAAYSPDNTQLAVALHMKEGGATKNSIAIYSLKDFKLVRSMELPQVKSTILSLKYSADGKRLATGSWDGRLLVFDLSKPQTQPWIQDLASGIHSVAFSTDGNQLVTGSEDGGLRLWTLPR
jgi:WD40 repeat protein